MLRFLLIVCAGAGIFASGCDSDRWSLRGKPSDEDVQVLLERPCRLRLEGATDPSHNLQQALEWVRRAAADENDTHGVPIEINWPSLRSAGAGPETPINLRIERSTLAQALHAILQIASADYVKNPIDYRIQKGAIQIAARRDLYQMANQTRIYNIRDLLVQLSDYDDLPAYQAKAANVSAGKPRQREVVVNGTKVLVEERPRPAGPSRPPPTSPPARRDAVVRDLINTIQSTVGRPEDWQYGAIHEINGDLIVSTTALNHDKVEHMLTDLRKSRAKSRKVLEKRQQK